MSPVERGTVVVPKSCPEKRTVITSRVTNQLVLAQIKTCREVAVVLREATGIVKEEIAVKVVAVATEIAAQAVVAEEATSIKVAAKEVAMEPQVEVSLQDPR